MSDAHNSMNLKEFKRVPLSLIPTMSQQVHKVQQSPALIKNQNVNLNLTQNRTEFLNPNQNMKNSLANSDKNIAFNLQQSTGKHGSFKPIFEVQTNSKPEFENEFPEKFDFQEQSHDISQVYLTTQNSIIKKEPKELKEPAGPTIAGQNKQFYESDFTFKNQNKEIFSPQHHQPLHRKQNTASFQNVFISSSSQQQQQLQQKQLSPPHGIISLAKPQNQQEFGMGEQQMIQPVYLSNTKDKSQPLTASQQQQQQQATPAATNISLLNTKKLQQQQEEDQSASMTSIKQQFMITKEQMQQIEQNIQQLKLKGETDLSNAKMEILQRACEDTNMLKQMAADIQKGISGSDILICSKSQFKEKVLNYLGEIIDEKINLFIRQLKNEQDSFEALKEKLNSEVNEINRQAMLELANLREKQTQLSIQQQSNKLEGQNKKSTQNNNNNEHIIRELQAMCSKLQAQNRQLQDEALSKEHQLLEENKRTLEQVQMLIKQKQDRKPPRPGSQSDLKQGIKSNKNDQNAQITDEKFNFEQFEDYLEELDEHHKKQTDTNTTHYYSQNVSEIGDAAINQQLQNQQIQQIQQAQVQTKMSDTNYNISTNSSNQTNQIIKQKYIPPVVVDKDGYTNNVYLEESSSELAVQEILPSFNNNNNKMSVQVKNNSVQEQLSKVSFQDVKSFTVPTNLLMNNYYNNNKTASVFQKKSQQNQFQFQQNDEQTFLSPLRQQSQTQSQVNNMINMPIQQQQQRNVYVSPNSNKNNNLNDSLTSNGIQQLQAYQQKYHKNVYGQGQTTGGMKKSSFMSPPYLNLQNKYDYLSSPGRSYISGAQQIFKSPESANSNFVNKFSSPKEFISNANTSQGQNYNNAYTNNAFAFAHARSPSSMINQQYIKNESQQLVQASQSQTNSNSALVNAVEKRLKHNNALQEKIMMESESRTPFKHQEKLPCRLNAGGYVIDEFGKYLLDNNNQMVKINKDQFQYLLNLQKIAQLN